MEILSERIPHQKALITKGGENYAPNDSEKYSEAAHIYKINTDFLDEKFNILRNNSNNYDALSNMY